MFGFIMRKAGYWFAKRQQTDQVPSPETPQKEISTKLDAALADVKDTTLSSSDLVVRRFFIGGDIRAEAAVVYIDGLVDSSLISRDMISPLLFDTSKSAVRQSGEDAIGVIHNSLVAANEAKITDSLYDAIDGFLQGDVTLFVDRSNKAIVMNAKGWRQRSISEPASEAVIRGPRESFVENLRTNTALLRRKIKNPALTFEPMVIGRRTRTAVAISYINGLAKKSVVDEVKKRLKAIKTDAILESGYIEQYIEDAPGSIFETVGYTEKPDVAAAKMLEGRVVVLVDGTPFVLTVPYLFLESFQAAEDYYFRPFFATITRAIRVIGYLITVFGPAFYVAVTTYHQELIPTSLLITMARAREGVPFPAVVESLIMIITFEILREAGIRLPRPVGQAMSIVGALVIGESAVSAGLIGAPMVIVVAITAVSGFLVPNQNNATILLRLIFLVMSATFGGFGITMAILGTLVHASSLTSFGYPYLSPSVPFDLDDQKDNLVRAPLWAMISRPKKMSGDLQRQQYAVPPDGQQSGGEGGRDEQ